MVERKQDVYRKQYDKLSWSNKINLVARLKNNTEYYFKV